MKWKGIAENYVSNSGSSTESTASNSGSSSSTSSPVDSSSSSDNTGSNGEDASDATDSETNTPDQPVTVANPTIPAEEVEVDSSLPTVQNVRAFGDDRNAIVVWDALPADVIDEFNIVGYYITYRPAGSDVPFRVRQQQSIDRGQFNDRNYPNAVQIQPLENGVSYEVHVQAASGSWQQTPMGDLVHQHTTSPDFPNAGYNYYPFADGRLSNKASTTVTPSGARVESMRSRLTGFFDDFNIPEGGFDELKWNIGTSACIQPNTGGAFINPQYHSHNQVRSDVKDVNCDRAGMVARPRATFDISSATEMNPAVIEFDLDGATQPRDTWYLDLIPIGSRPKTLLPIDITTHNSSDDKDMEDPGNTLRINAGNGGIHIAYYDKERNPTYLPLELEDETLACLIYYSGDAPLGIDVRLGCDKNKRITSLSPLPFPDLSLRPITNVPQQWRIELTPTKLRLYINGFHVTTSSLPDDFVAEQKYTLHFTTFSYNTGKQYNQVVPYVEMLHWDNFGFSGPAPTEVIHNYIEGGEMGDTPVFSTSNGPYYDIPNFSRTTTLPIPDPIGQLVDGKARLFYTLAQFTYDPYQPWEELVDPTIVVNGHSYPFENPKKNMVNPREVIYSLHQPLSLHLLVNQEHLIRGNNVIEFNIGRTSVYNVHFELPYTKGDKTKPIPVYSSPTDIFGTAYLDITNPPMTNCDMFWTVERDLGLPYEDGKKNLEKGECKLINGHQMTVPDPNMTNMTGM